MERKSHKEKGSVLKAFDKFKDARGLLPFTFLEQTASGVLVRDIDHDRSLHYFTKEQLEYLLGTVTPGNIVEISFFAKRKDYTSELYSTRFLVPSGSLVPVLSGVLDAQKEEEEIESCSKNADFAAAIAAYEKRKKYEAMEKENHLLKTENARLQKLSGELFEEQQKRQAMEKELESKRGIINMVGLAGRDILGRFLERKGGKIAGTLSGITGLPSDLWELFLKGEGEVQENAPSDRLSELIAGLSEAERAEIALLIENFLKEKYA